MNVFVLSTGRCGSTTFIAACAQIRNYSAGHQTRGGLLFDRRLAYPANHIESDNRLAWFLGRLEDRYGDDAFYVHLLRDREKTAESYNRRWHIGVGIMPAYAQSLLIENTRRDLDVCLDYVDTVNANIRLFLKDKTRRMDFALENAEEDFRVFWERIGAQGDLESALQKWQVRYNTLTTDDERPQSDESSLREAYFLEPDNPARLDAWLRLLLDARRPDDALAALRQALARLGNRADSAAFRQTVAALAARIHTALIEAAVAQGQMDRVRELFDSLEGFLGRRQAAGVPRAGGGDRRAEADRLLQQGAQALKSGQTDRAIPVLRRALELDPNNVLVLNDLGVAMSRKDWRNAYTYFHRAFTLAPQTPGVPTNLAIAAVESGNLDVAVQLVARRDSPLDYRVASNVMRRFAESEAAREVAGIRTGMRLFADLCRTLGRDPDRDGVTLSIFANHLHPGIPWRERTLDRADAEELGKWVSVRGVEKLRALQQIGRGAVVVLSHFAAERVATLVLSRMGFRINSLEFKNRLGDHGVAGVSDVNVLELEGKESFPLREVYLAQQALGRGEIFQLAGDGYRGGSEVQVDFLGRRRGFKAGFAELALGAGVSAIPVFCSVDLGGRIRMEILEPVDAGDPGQDRRERVHTLVSNYAALLEARWRSDPSNVVWDHIRRYLELTPAVPDPTGAGS
jgi:Flp pilus assembly protein TadD/lauroyl/myristoyl acyltransferase